MTRSKWTNPENEELLKKAVRDSESIAGVCRVLNLSPKGGNIATMRHHIARLNLDVSHHKGQSWRKDRYLEPHKTRSIGAIRSRLLRDRGHRCEICGISEWMGEPAPLEMDHINGDNKDNRDENLRLLCCNCHAQTPTFRNKRGKAGHTLRERVTKTRENTKLCACGRTIKQESRTCKFCRVRDTKLNWPPVELVIRDLEESNFSKVSKRYGVSDNSIRKFLMRNGINPKTLKPV